MSQGRHWIRTHDNGWESRVSPGDSGYVAAVSRPPSMGAGGALPPIEYPVHRSYLSTEHAKVGADAELRRRSDHPTCSNRCEEWSR